MPCGGGNVCGGAAASLSHSTCQDLGIQYLPRSELAGNSAQARWQRDPRRGRGAWRMADDKEEKKAAKAREKADKAKAKEDKARYQAEMDAYVPTQNTPA